jgi:hypothetical protein
MKMIMPLALAALAILAGCQPASDTQATSEPVSAADRMAEIAGDKTMTADVMRRSHERGTFDDALGLALQDSALAAEVIGVLKNDPRFAAMLAPESAPSTARNGSASRATTVRQAARTTSSGARSGDALDKTENAVRKANEKIDQAARVKQGASDAAKKVEGIFRR